MVAKAAQPNLNAGSSEVAESSEVVESHVGDRAATILAPAPKSNALSRPCPSGSPEHRDALKQLHLLQAGIPVLTATSNPGSLSSVLKRLVEHPCLALARGVGNAPSKIPDTVVTLQRFWNDGGGQWLETEINRANSRNYVFVPDVHAELLLETHLGHPLKSLLCSKTDRACNSQTAEWAARAAQALASRSSDGGTPGADHVAEAPTQCLVKANGYHRIHRLTQWHMCRDGQRENHQAIPLWPPRSPKQGWLVVHGRRGHYTFCDQVGVFDLASGAAFRIQSCSGLALANGGATNTNRSRTFHRGSVNVENLRETAWMLLMLDSVESLRGLEVDTIPAEIELVSGADGIITGSMIGVFMASSAQTTLFWRIINSEVGEPSGTLTWPTDYNSRAAAHAVNLLRVAEASFADGCPKSRPPKLNTARVRGGVSSVDSDPVQLALLQSSLFKDLARQAATTHRCPRH